MSSAGCEERVGMTADSARDRAHRIGGRLAFGIAARLQDVFEREREENPRVSGERACCIEAMPPSGSAGKTCGAAVLVRVEAAGAATRCEGRAS
jgi:hypothetical protein